MEIKYIITTFALIKKQIHEWKTFALILVTESREVCVSELQKSLQYEHHGDRIKVVIEELAQWRDRKIRTADLRKKILYSEFDKELKNFYSAYEAFQNFTCNLLRNYESYDALSKDDREKFVQNHLPLSRIFEAVRDLLARIISSQVGYTMNRVKGRTMISARETMR